MDKQKINYVCIKSYNYKMEDIMKYYNNFFDIIKRCKLEYDSYEESKDESQITREKLINYSRLEILKSDTICRFFLDIENLTEQDNIEFVRINEKYIYPKFLEDFENYMGFKHQSFTITLNNNTEHGGLSYHIIWPYSIKFSDIKKYIIDFINHNPNYAGYIDSSIYSKRRIFRNVYQHKPALRRNGRRINDYHKIIFSNSISDIDNNLDYCISNSILQNIYNLESVSKNINISYDDVVKYSTIYSDAKKKESEQLKQNLNNGNTQEEGKEPYEKIQTNNITTEQHIYKENFIKHFLNDAKNGGVNVNNPEELLKFISQLIEYNNSKH